MHRRQFLCAASAATATACVSPDGWKPAPLVEDHFHVAPTRSVIPVVGDGKWVWRDPPKDQTGYLEPRDYQLKVGIEAVGRGNATNILATTPVPLHQPGQEINSATIDKQGCLADFRRLTPEAGQLVLSAPAIQKGQTIRATADIALTLYKDYQGFTKEQFPAEQPAVPKDFAKVYLYDSPGIQTSDPAVKKLAAKVGGGIKHPWDKAHAYYRWVWENIRPRIGSYTSVTAAIRDRIGDCEEHAAVFVALCRASGIPARLVWVPNHNWAEFALCDGQSKGHWIPAHTSAYSWFGWTGVHELVLQKGDSVKLPEKRKPQRLMEDWMQWSGARPEARWWAELKPLQPEESADPGPGARSKNDRGEWVAVGSHPLDRYLRDGALASRAPQGQ